MSWYGSGTSIKSDEVELVYWSFTFYVDAFFLLSLPRLLPDLAAYMSNTVSVV
jgi:hypothetical protein